MHKRKTDRGRESEERERGGGNQNTFCTACKSDLATSKKTDLGPEFGATGVVGC